MAKIVTLKKNDEYVYPVTTGEAVIGAVYTEDQGEDTAATPWVSSDMIDWGTTLPVTTRVAGTGGNNNPTWIKRVFPNGVIEYYCHTEPNWATGASTWAADRTVGLPEGLVFDWNRMVFTGNALFGDAAVRADVGIGNGKAYFNVNRHNAYSGSITAICFIDAILTVYPA